MAIELSSQLKNKQMSNSPNKIGKYTVTKSIGSGGQGSVYLCEDGRGKVVAIKNVQFEEADKLNTALEEVIFGYFLLLTTAIVQASVCLRFDHPNVIKSSSLFVHEYQGGNNVLCHVMPYYEKGDLSKLLEEHRKKEKPFSEKVCVDFWIWATKFLVHT